jgi:putative lipoic acid-binding regulatory protein
MSLTILSTLILAFAVYTLPSGLAAQASQAPGGFVEMMTSTVARAQPGPTQIAQFVPASRGRFFFPAPYNTEAYRITLPSDCGGTDCIQQEGYSAWRNINNHAGQPVLRMFIGLQDTTYITLFTLDKATGTVTNNGPVWPFSSSNPLSYSRGGGWFWSGTDPDILYAYATSQLVAKNVVTGAQTVVLDLASTGAQAAHGQGTNVRVWAATGSDDGNSWAMTVRVGGGSDVGCALYHRPTNAWHYLAYGGGDCFVDKSGTYWTASIAPRDIRKGTMNPFTVGDTLTDPMGAPGHLDHGFGFLIGEDNWAGPQELRLWDLSQPFTAAGQGRTVHTMVQWGTDSYVQPTMGNARPATMATIGSQFACSTATFSTAPSPPVAREREIVCFPLDGSGRMLVVAPNMTNMAAPGGGIPYYRAPKGNLDTTGEYYYWITNLGGNRLEAFLVRVPWQVLMGGGSGDTTLPTVALSAPASGATVNGTVTVSATASDNVGVTGVQFRLDGANIGSEDTTSPYSISWNTTSAANGSHSLTAIARDAAGNTRTSSPVDVTVQNSAPVDTTLPTVSLTAPANGATVSATISVAATASDNVGVAGVQFLLDGANLGAEDTSSPYSMSWNTTAAANGTHTIAARARDAAGNTQMSSVTVTVQNQAADTTLPTVSLTEPASGATVSGTVAVSATASDNVGVAGVQFRVDGANVGAEDTTSPYSVNWNTATIANGNHTLTAVARDAAGNTATASRSVTVSNSQTPGGGLLAAYGFNESGGTSTADSSPTGNTATLAGAATWATGRYGSSLSMTGASHAEAPDHDALTAGTTATFEAWVYLTSKPNEVASIANKWNESADDEFFFGLAPDQTPIFGWHTTGGSSWGTLAYGYATGTGVVPLNTWTHVAVVRNGATLSFYLNGTLSGSATAMDTNPFRGGTASLRIGGQARGGQNRYFPGRIDELRIYGRALTQEEIQADLNAPIGSTGDTTPPSVSLTAPANGATVSGTVTVSATAADGGGVAGVQFRLDGANLGGEDTTSPYSISWNTTTVGNGSHTLTAVARDAAGNTATASSITVTVQNQAVDTTVPTVSLTAPASGATVSGSIAVSATASDNVGVAGVQFRLDGANLGAEDTTSPYSISWNTTTAANGSHTLTAVARDAAGNTATASSITVTVQNQAPGDVTPPTVALTAPANGVTVSGSIAVSATASDNVGVAGVQFKVDGVNIGAEDTSSPYSSTWNTATAGNGSHTLTAVARDAAGNVTTSASRTVTVSNVAPAAGLVAAYGFNENGGSTTADSSPGNNAATLSGASWATGRFGSALAANGAGYANAPDTAAQTPGTTATFEAWVYLTSAPGGLVSILNKWSQTAEDEYLLGLLANRRVFFTWKTTGASTWGTPSFNEITSAATVPLNVWTHIAVVRSGTKLTFYLNGVLASSSAPMDNNPFRDGTNSLRVGGQNRGGVTRYFPGLIDEVRIYNRELNAVEIQTDMNTPVGAAASLLTDAWRGIERQRFLDPFRGERLTTR